MRWDMTDIAWSIWASSFILAVISTVAGNVFFFWLLEKEPTEEQKANPKYNPQTTEGNLFSSLFLLFAQLVPIVGLNSIVVMQLHEVLPFPAELHYSELLFGDKLGLDTMFAVLVSAIKHYWLFLCITLWAPIRSYYQMIRQKLYEQDETQAELILNPYYETYSIQALMLVLMVVSALANEHLVYWALLFFYFFPWSLLWDWLKQLWQERKKKIKK